MDRKVSGAPSKQAPDEEECRDIWERYHTPGRIREHCEAVLRQAERIAAGLAKAGETLDLQVVRSAALLHDVARAQPGHAEKGADVLQREGYPIVAEVIRCHHDLEPPGRQGMLSKIPDLWLEKAVVYLADKRVQEDRVVSIEKRFADSRRRCEKAEDREAALKALERRYRQAKEIEDLIQTKIDGGDQR